MSIRGPRRSRRSRFGARRPRDEIHSKTLARKRPGCANVRFARTAWLAQRVCRIKSVASMMRTCMPPRSANRKRGRSRRRRNNACACRRIVNFRGQSRNARIRVSGRDRSAIDRPPKLRALRARMRVLSRQDSPRSARFQHARRGEFARCRKRTVASIRQPYRLASTTSGVAGQQTISRAVSRSGPIDRSNGTSALARERLNERPASTTFRHGSRRARCDTDARTAIDAACARADCLPGRGAAA